MERATDCGSGEDLQQNNVDAAPSARSNMPAVEVPGELGDYELLEEVGRGGQGVVFRARQKSLHRIVALKVIGLGQWATKAHLKALPARSRSRCEPRSSVDRPNLRGGRARWAVLLQHEVCRRRSARRGS